MASFHCYDNSDVIVTLIITNFYLYLIQLSWYFFKIFVNGDVVYAQTSEVLTMKTPSSCLNKVCLIAHYNSGNGKRLYFDHFWLQKSKVLMSLIFACNLR